MLNQTLNSKLFDADCDQKPTRDGYGEGLLQAGIDDEKVVALCADLTESTKTNLFAKKFPERFIQVGVAEQNLATVASGLAAMGKIPFLASYAMFSPGRNWEQIRTTICYNNRNVKIVGAHAGVSVGPDGATHQALEDIALMRAIPNMTVLYPCDAVEARKATLAAAKTEGQFYIRLAREKTPIITTEQTPFEIGKANIMFESDNPQVAIIATGPLVFEALKSAKQLAEEEINTTVINLATIKPFDKETILNVVKKTKAVVTVEEHQVSAGMGSAVAELLAENFPVPIEFVAVRDLFGQSGEMVELLEHYKLNSKAIAEAVKKVIGRKS